MIYVGIHLAVDFNQFKTFSKEIFYNSILSIKKEVKNGPKDENYGKDEKKSKWNKKNLK